MDRTPSKPRCAEALGGGLGVAHIAVAGTEGVKDSLLQQLLNAWKEAERANAQAPSAVPD